MKKVSKALLKKRERKKQKRLEKEKFASWRKSILERDNYTDQISGKQSGGHLHVHHILDKKNFPQFKFEVNNGITLNYWNHKVGNLSPHLNSIFFSFWLQNHKPEQYQWVLSKLAEMGLIIPQSAKNLQS